MNLTLKRSAPYATSVQVMGERRLGVATALYDAAEKVLGRKLIPSPLGLSPEAIAFWKNRLSKMEPEEKQALLAESLKVGQEAGVAKSARDRVDSLGYREPETAMFNIGAPGPVATPEQKESFYRPPAKTLDQVYEEAPGLQETLGEIGKEITDAVDGAKFKNPGIKKRETAEEKVGRKSYENAAEMTDIVRAGFIVQNPSQANAIIKRLSEYFEVLDEGWFRTEQEYFDRKALIKFPSGQVGEVQFWEPNMFAAKMTKAFGPRSGEEIYTEVRDITDKNSPRALELNRQMFEMYSKARGEMEPHWQNVGLLTKPPPRYLKVAVKPKPMPKGKALAYPTAKPDDWYSDLDYKARGGVMETMSPQEFLDRVRPLKIDESSRDNIDDLKRHIQSGRTLDPLKIYSDGTEDGRHRAVAAKELGIKEVPVIVFPPQKERPKFKTGEKPTGEKPTGERPLSKVTETPQGPIHFATSPAFAAKADAVHADLRKKLDALGLTGVDLNVWQQIFADWNTARSARTACTSGT